MRLYISRAAAGALPRVLTRTRLCAPCITSLVSWIVVLLIESHPGSFSHVLTRADRLGGESCLTLLAGGGVDTVATFLRLPAFIRDIICRTIFESCVFPISSGAGGSELDDRSAILLAHPLASRQCSIVERHCRL